MLGTRIISLYLYNLRKMLCSVYNTNTQYCSTMQILALWSTVFALYQYCTLFRNYELFKHVIIAIRHVIIAQDRLSSPRNIFVIIAWGPLLVGQGRHCHPNLKHNSIMRLAPLNFWSNIYNSSSRGNRGKVPSRTQIL